MDNQQSTIRFLAGRLTAFLAAVAITYLLASITATQSVVASLAGMGVDIGFAGRLSMTMRDIAGMAPMFLPLVAFALLFALLGAALLSYWLRGWRLPLYLLAGATGVVCIHLGLHLAFDITPVAVARTGGGLLLQGIAGAAGGYGYLAIARRMGKGPTARQPGGPGKPAV